ncbi:M48 family metallopeptidase [Dongia deserti]|uniref:M48 family metallopeptidase n=1 Tax=Dongia deserti TaxID=2268030 RepID=UPI0013C3E75D|nr:M48 family metallopeptidase [Dongia deserti]
MRASRIACLAAALCLAVQGCGGTTFALPPVSPQEALLAAREIGADPDLPQFPRTRTYYRSAIKRIEKQLTERVASICVRAETRNCHFTFHYVDDDEVNAFTDEAGHIYLHRGLLDYLETDEEIAAVMAHEMSHQIAGHVDESTRSILLGALLGGLLMGGAAAAGGADRDSVDGMTALGLEYGGRIGMLTFSKEQEREADLLAAYVLARAGFDLQRAGRTFEVLAKLDDKTIASWKDTHPAGAERIVAWRKAVAEVEESPDKLPTMTKR